MLEEPLDGGDHRTIRMQLGTPVAAQVWKMPRSVGPCVPKAPAEDEAEAYQEKNKERVASLGRQVKALLHEGDIDGAY
eukprot:10813393-Lingulodinium_polyedra.AAC.1